MLAPYAVDIAGIISSLIASLCFTFAEPFDDNLKKISLRQVKLCIDQRKYKQKFTTKERSDRPTYQASEFVLAHLTPISHSAKSRS